MAYKTVSVGTYWVIVVNYFSFDEPRISKGAVCIYFFGYVIACRVYDFWYYISYALLDCSEIAGRYV